MSKTSASAFIVNDWMAESPGGRMHLLGQRCGQCDVARWPPTEHCEACSSPEFDPLRLGPEAELYSVTVDWTGTFLGYPHLVGQVRFPQGTFAQGFVVGDIGQPPAIGDTMELVPFDVTVQGEVLVTYAFKSKGEA